MRISAKTKYGLSSMIKLAEFYESNDLKTIGYLSEQLHISKIYLEQVFSLLKRNELVVSSKGPQGGYRLAKSPDKISAYDILFTMETSLFEKSEKGFKDDNVNIEKAIIGDILLPMDRKIKIQLESVSLQMLSQHVQEYDSNDGFMYYL